MLIIADTAQKRLYVGGQSWPMALGRNGVTPAALKREGDGRTPLGRYWLEYLCYRSDRVALPEAPMACHAVKDGDGWCDAPGDKRYNQAIMQPFAASHETLMREDCLYDMLIVLSHNRWPAVAGYGSAIFLHIAREEAGTLKPTQGCLALKRKDFIAFLASIKPRSDILIR